MIPVDERWKAAREYLLQLAQASETHWESAHASWAAGGLGLPAAMVLVHPMWLPPGIPQGLAQGTSSFGGPGLAADECMAPLLWGYECPFQGQVMHADHVWPYWAGGPTVGANRLPLCRVHNGMKSGDVHLFPWERGAPPWLEAQLTRMRELRR